MTALQTQTPTPTQGNRTEKQKPNVKNGSSVKNRYCSYNQRWVSQNEHGILNPSIEKDKINEGVRLPRKQQSSAQTAVQVPAEFHSNNKQNTLVIVSKSEADP